ncbi:RNA polymerase sigma factor [Streptomyces anulatus]
MTRGGNKRRSQESDLELGRAVSLAQCGDESAFEKVYHLVHPGLFGYVRGLVGADADDVASDAWLEIARDLRRFRGDGVGFRGWTAAIARNRAMDHLRKQGRGPRTSLIEQEVLNLPGRADTANAVLEAMSTRTALARIAGLPPEQAEAVLLRVVVGLDGPAAARVLGKRPGAVRTAAHRGLRRLAEQLTPASRAKTARDAVPGPLRDET